MDLDAVKAFVESFTAQGASITREDWRAQLKKAAAASTDTNADGTLLYGRGWEPNRHTIDQYMQLSLEWGEKTNENKVPEKSMQRIMAESSVISMMSNAIATTYSLVRICEEGCALNPPPPGNDIARYWAKVYGVSKKCLDLLDPALVSNTDGTTRFVYEGKDKKGGKDNWVISPKDGAGLTSARSTFTTGTMTPTNGLRVVTDISVIPSGPTWRWFKYPSLLAPINTWFMSPGETPWPTSTARARSPRLWVRKRARWWRLEWQETWRW